MNHTLLTTDKAEIIGLLPLDNASRFKITITSGISYLWYYIDDGEPMIEKLGRGNWQLLGWSDEITPSQKYLVVDGERKVFDIFHGFKSGYYDFVKNKVIIGITVEESFTSLLASKGITKRLYLIYKLK